EARKRAREAKARLDAQRRDHDQNVEDATTRFYETDEKYRQALAAADDLRQQRDAIILELVALERTTTRVATLTGLEKKTITTAKRAHTAKQTEPHNHAAATST